MIFKVEDITEQAMQAELDQRMAQENQRLDRLAQQLRTDRDHRTQDYLTLLRSLRSDFEQAAHRPGIQFRSAQMREQVSLVFAAAVEQLQQSYRLWELAESLVGNARKKVLADREEVLREVETTVERLQGTVEQFGKLIKTDSQVDLASMREELEATMRIAQRTEQRMRELENPSVNHEAFLRE
jgi:RNA polymerase-binding transcription factor DksA